MLFVIAAVLVGLGGLSYWLGLWDWPDFVVRELLPDNKNKGLYAIVCTSTDKNFPTVIPRLLQDTKQGILDANPQNSPKLMQESAKMYGAPDGAEYLSVGLYFEDPHKVEKPKWAIGWCVATRNFPQAQELAKQVASKVQLQGEDEAIRAVRVGPGPVLTARIPWRHMLTPMVAPMLHWKRGTRAYEEGGYKSTGGPPDSECCVCCEIYVTGPKDSMEYIDYIVLMGDVSNVWRDAFPSAFAK